MDFQVGPDGQPPRFDGAAWVSQDGRHFWNGGAWQPMKKPRTRISGLVIALGVLIVAGVAYIVFAELSPKPFEGDGVSNARIDSSTEIEFDYLRSTTCSNLSFEYRFYDRGGSQVDTFHDVKGDVVTAGVIHHFDSHTDPLQPIDSRAYSFVADATCSG
jgi:hypothetical protein